MKFLNKIDGAKDLVQDSNNRLVTDAEKATWNAKGTSNLALGTTSLTAFRGDYGNTAYTHSQSAHAPSGAQVNQTLTSGNGMAAWTATNGNLTIPLGTPSTLTTATTNAVTTTSHTHSVTFPVTSVAGKTGAVILGPTDVGAAATSHNHNTSYALKSVASGAVNASTFVDSGIMYVSGLTGVFSGIQDGALYTHSYSSSWIGQIFQDYRSGQIALRGKNNGTWQNWRIVLDSINWPSYCAPASHTHAYVPTTRTVNSKALSADIALTAADVGAATSGHNHDISTTTGNLPANRISEPPYVTASTTRTARPLFDVLRADRTSFLPETQIIIEESTDAGVTWTDANVSDSTKRKLFTGQRPSILIPRKNGVKSTDCMIRITITGMRYNVPAETIETERYNYWNSTYVQSTERYFAPQEGWVWVSSNSDRIYLKVEKATGSNSNSWSLDREAYLAGWSGGNYFSLSGGAFGGGTTQTSNTWNWRFTFRTCSSQNTFNDADLSASYTTSSQTIHHIKISGQNVYSYSNNYMYHDHLYNWDEYKNAIFPAEIKGSTFRKSDGTEVAYKTEIPSALSELNKNINFDERYYTETEVDTKLNDKADKSQVLTNVPANAKFTDTVYTHPTTAGNKHIPSGGATGQFLKWSSNGTATWADDVTDLAGAGRTTETVKGNADAIANRALTLNNGALQTVADKNKYYPLLSNVAGTLIGTHQTNIWDGSSWWETNNYGFGSEALSNNTGSESNGFGYQALSNNIGSLSNGFGYFALQNNIGENSNGFGAGALMNNTGERSNGFGSFTLYNNTGSSSNGFGYEALRSNTGENSNGFGYQALRDNTVADSNGFGYQALYNNAGMNSNGFGNFALAENTGASSNGFGFEALVVNTGAYSNGFGQSALANNSGERSNGFGQYALSDNTGTHSNGFGHSALSGNTGPYSNGFGSYALSSNIGENSNGFGYQALQNNTGVESNGFGDSALMNNKGSYSSGFGHYALSNNEGYDCSGFGYNTLESNEGSSCNGFGAFALSNNTAGSSNGFGHNALAYNTGESSNGFGLEALRHNTGIYSNGFGRYALRNNTGVASNGFGYNAMMNNTGTYSSGFGHAALSDNTGANASGFGYSALMYNQLSNNTAVGHSAYSTFIDNAAGNKTCPYTNINITISRATITAHGFGAIDAIVFLKYTARSGNAIGGLTLYEVFQAKIIDANTIEFVKGSQKRGLWSAGTGTHTFTPQFAYENTTCLGANTVPNRSHQVVLGNTQVDTVKMGGTTRTPASANATGVKGEMCWDTNYVYICVATNTWKRSALSTW